MLIVETKDNRHPYTGGNVLDVTKGNKAFMVVMRIDEYVMDSKYPRTEERNFGVYKSKSAALNKARGIVEQMERSHASILFSTHDKGEYNCFTNTTSSNTSPSGLLGMITEVEVVEVKLYV